MQLESTTGPTPGSNASAFDPPGTVWVPVATKLIPARSLVAGIWLVPITVGLGIVAVLTGWGFLWFPCVFMALLTVWIFVLIPRQVRAIAYAEREDDLLVRRGVLLRQLVVVPYGRMQQVDVEAGPIDRAFGISTVQLHTASAGTDATIPGLTADEAARLRDRLTAIGEARLAGL